MHSLRDIHTRPTRKRIFLSLLPLLSVNSKLKKVARSYVAFVFDQCKVGFKVTYRLDKGECIYAKHLTVFPFLFTEYQFQFKPHFVAWAAMPKNLIHENLASKRKYKYFMHCVYVSVDVGTKGLSVEIPKDDEIERYVYYVIPRTKLYVAFISLLPH